MNIAVLTSGGDAPGMNAAIRTVVVVGLERGHTVYGIKGGYAGLLEGDFIEMDRASVSGISSFGGTILGSARSSLFPTPEGQAKAKARLTDKGIEGLIVIGGNGSLTGAQLLGKDGPCKIMGIPASIDNDVGHCGMAIGVDTAVNTIVEACDRISDTARAHKRAFIVEVMGRQCGFLAMRSGVAAEADAILFGEAHEGEDDLVERLRIVLRDTIGSRWYKQRALIIKAEGVDVPTSRLVRRLQEYLDEDAPGVEIRATVLGHLVRGGRPSGLDRMIAQRLAFAAVLAIEGGVHDMMASWDAPGMPGQQTMDAHVRLVPIADVLEETQRMIDGTSRVVQGWMALLNQVKDLLIV